jgi:hypothetical protein
MAMMLAAASRRASCAVLGVFDASRVEDQPLITRAELAAALFALHDILDEVRRIRRLLSDGQEKEDLGE